LCFQKVIIINRQKFLFYISAASTISHQPTFKNVGFSDTVGVLVEGSTLINPDFKEYIEPGLLRRMSKILRISVACAKDCLAQASIEQPDAIVVGTGLGCLLDTEKFLNNFLTIEGLLPPTSFIQSTHNTIAGQISLSLGNHGYNMTHTQNSLSFEHALQDAALLLGEGNARILVGAADEHIGILDEIGKELNIGSVFLTSGASFFVLENERSDGALARLADTESIGLVKDVSAEIDSFLARNEMGAGMIDEVYFADTSSDAVLRRLNSAFSDNTRFVNYPLYSGWYATNSAFALHFALDRMKSDRKINNVLICNYLLHNNLGLTLLRSLEA
jgi:3-oxoacyl-[acyl-carrier-protein] synthase II